MRRAAVEKAIAKRNHRMHLRFVHNDGPAACVCEVQVGRFRKRDGLDCGKTQCKLCHQDKIFQRPTRQETRGRDRLVAGIQEGD